MSPINNSPHFYVSMLEFLITAKQQLIAIGKEYDLTLMQTNTLLLIDREQPRPMNTFCKLYGCDASNVTGIIDGLEEKSLVHRSEDQHDRRIKVIVLDPLGAELKDTIITKLTETSDELFSPLTSEERAQFIELITKLAHASFAHSLA